MNDEEFEQWQEQRNAAVYAALMELLIGLEQMPNAAPWFYELAKSCKQLLKEFDN